ncbi:hypothetical protein HY412_00815 [Candidatus Kaiserbacteria bacterium]|nr:hypothetical protein [Candidatus Kaiserbacteria bacterium]
MFGIFLAGISAAFEELTNSLGKRKIGDGTESYYTFGFLTQFFSALLILGAGLLLNNLVFALDSLVTFIPRVLVAILEIQLAVIALVKVDRGNIGFIRLATIPLLLLTDLALGYSLSVFQILGMCLIVAPIIVLFSQGKNDKGLWLALTVAALAAVDISLYKYDISHFNSVEAEQAIISLILSLYFFITAAIVRRENPILFLKRPVYLIQTGSSGLAYVVGSFSYLFAPASIITAAFRGFSVLFSILTGQFYFKEKNFLVRFGLFILIVDGLLLLIKA